MPTSTVLEFFALTTLALFVATSLSLIRLARAGVIDGRRADGSPSREAILHSVAKLILVLAISVAQSRVLLAPEWPGGPLAPDLAMLWAALVSVIASVPAAVFVALALRHEARPRLAALVAVAVATIAFGGAGQVLMSGIAAGRDLGSLLAPAAALSVISCGLVGCAGVYLHARLARQIVAHPQSVSAALADAAFVAISTTLVVWLGCLAYAGR